jgi:hypothetical protein
MRWNLKHLKILAPCLQNNRLETDGYAYNYTRTNKYTIKASFSGEFKIGINLLVDEISSFNY